MSKLIEQIAERLGASYIYDDFARINLRADSVEKFPLIVETLPVDGSLNMRFLPVVQAQKNVTIAFLEPCPLDFDGARVDVHLAHMLELATAFVRELAKVGGVNIPDDLDYNAVLDFMDANVVGVRVTLALPETFTCQSVFNYTEPVATIWLTRADFSNDTAQAIYKMGAQDIPTSDALINELWKTNEAQVIAVEVQKKEFARRYETLTEEERQAINVEYGEETPEITSELNEVWLYNNGEIKQSNKAPYVNAVKEILGDSDTQRALLIFDQVLDTSEPVMIRKETPRGVFDFAQYILTLNQQTGKALTWGEPEPAVPAIWLTYGQNDTYTTRAIQRMGAFEHPQDAQKIRDAFLVDKKPVAVAKNVTIEDFYSRHKSVDDVDLQQSRFCWILGEPQTNGELWLTSSNKGTTRIRVVKCVREADKGYRINGSQEAYYKALDVATQIVTEHWQDGHVATSFPFVKITREAWESECNNDIRTTYANEGVFVEWREGVTHE